MNEKEIKFLSFIRKTKSCWIWMGTIEAHGYGSFWLGKKATPAHRFSYELANGPIPAGLVCDHICRVRLCVNPAHLRAVTDKENILSGISPPAINARKIRCIKGHDLKGQNLRRWNTYRSCKICAYEKNRELAQRKKNHFKNNTDIDPKWIYANKKQGEKHHKHKLTERQVLRIREMRGVNSSRNLAKEFGVNQSCIMKVWSGESWGYLSSSAQVVEKYKKETLGEI